MALMLTHRPDPAALHVSLTLDVKPMQAKRAAIADLILLANERLWLGHFDYS
ncbi:MAG: YbjN domain-containing protein, partial [Pleurocapsa sp. SU_196_0]|nr:YbjN domain-containing protein [Pleurocapsa sp. SU_196_0]